MRETVPSLCSKNGAKKDLLSAFWAGKASTSCSMPCAHARAASAFRAVVTNDAAASKFGRVLKDVKDQAAGRKRLISSCYVADKS